MISLKKKYPTVILADGRFPSQKIPLGILDTAQRIIACDASVESLINYGMEPTAIVGDLDSISQDLKYGFSDRLFQDTDQEHNDLTKSVHWCLERDMRDIAILGATGKREDHSIGNISLLADYTLHLDAVMITDWGFFTVIRESAEFESFPDQQVSIFALDNTQQITTENLHYPLNNAYLKSWWMGTLNESMTDQFRIILKNSTPVLVYCVF